MLKRNLAYTLFFSLVLFFGRQEKLCAQDTLNFTPNGFLGMPDTVYAGYQTQVGALIKNYSSILYHDSISIDYYIDTGAAVTTIPGVVDTNFTLNPGDSQFFLIPFTFNDHYQGGPFRIGNNVIVVWPRIFDPNFHFSDSLRANVFVIDTSTGTGPVYGNSFDVKCYPVPSSGPLYIASNISSARITKIILRDAGGQLVASSKDPSQPIDLSSLPPGMYVVEVTFDNNKTGWYKILRR